MIIKPLKDKILIKLKETEEKTKGGIYMPESAKEEKTIEGEVVAVGDSPDITVRPGDKVLFDGLGAEIKIDGKKHLIMNIKDILAKVE